jgi:hypothetical protein
MTKKILLAGAALLVVLWLGHESLSGLTCLTQVQAKSSALVSNLN